MNAPSDTTGRGVEIVVKIGGSLLEPRAISALLEDLGQSGARLALVPGGGPFADAVRAAQPALGLSDRAAHYMAILGMQQMALALLDMQPTLAAAEEEGDFPRILDAGRVPIWLPDRMTRHDCTIPADWSITSDGLAARLAERLGARRVVLFKAVDIDPGTGLDELASAGVIDAAFGRIVERAGLAWAALGPGQRDRFSAWRSGASENAASRSG